MTVKFLWLAQGRVSAHGEVVHQHAETIVAHHVLQAARDIPAAAPGAVAGLHDAEIPEVIARAIAGIITGEAASRKHSGVDGLSFVVDEVTHSPAPVTGMDAQDLVLPAGWIDAHGGIVHPEVGPVRQPPDRVGYIHAVVVDAIIGAHYLPTLCRSPGGTQRRANRNCKVHSKAFRQYALKLYLHGRISNRPPQCHLEQATSFFCSCGVEGPLQRQRPCAAFPAAVYIDGRLHNCLLYTSPSPRDGLLSRMP